MLLSGFAVAAGAGVGLLFGFAAAAGAGVGLLFGFAVAAGAGVGLPFGFAVAAGAGVGLLSGFGVAVGAGVAGAASFSKIALISTLLSGMVNLSFLMVTPPLMTCHSLKWKPLSGVALRVISVPAAAAAGAAKAVPLPSVVTVTVLAVTCRATRASCCAERFPALSCARRYRESSVSLSSR